MGFGFGGGVDPEIPTVLVPVWMVLPATFFLNLSRGDNAVAVAVGVVGVVWGGLDAGGPVATGVGAAGGLLLALTAAGWLAAVGGLFPTLTAVALLAAAGGLFPLFPAAGWLPLV